MIAVVVVAIATYLAYRVAERERGLKSRELFVMTAVSPSSTSSFGYGATPVLDDVSLEVAARRVLRIPRSVGLAARPRCCG